MDSNNKTKRDAVSLAHSVYDFCGLNGQIKIAAQKVPIIVVPCELSCRESYDSLARQLVNDTKRKVYVVDIRNHGQSPRGESSDFFDMATDLELFLKTEDIEKAHFIAHSMSGRTVMVFGTLKPELVASMTIVDITPFYQPANISKVIHEHIENLKKALEELPRGISLEDSRIKCRRKFSEQKIEKSAIEFMVTSLVLNSDKVSCLTDLDFLEQRFDFDMRQFPKFNVYYEGPVKCVHGSNSEYLRPCDYLPLYKIFPDVDISRVENCGHHVAFEQSEQFLDLVVSFLDALP